MRSSKFVGCCSCIILFAFTSWKENVIAADQINFTKSDAETVRLVAESIRQRHLENPKFDDSLSVQLLNDFVESWDPSKIYFLKADIDVFQTSRHVLDDQIIQGNADFAKLVFDRFQLRQQELTKMIGTLIDKDHDFTIDESLSMNFEERSWASTNEERQERWRKRVKSELLVLSLEGEQSAGAKKMLHRRYQNSREMLKQTETHELLEIYLTSLTRCLDPHSTFMAPDSREEFDIAMTLQLQGIGARLQFTDGNTVVDEVVPGGAAAADGRLMKGDTIVGVDRANDGTMTDVVGLKLSRVVEHIRGPKGSIVRLKIQKASGESAIYDLTRQVIKLGGQEAKGEILDAGEWIPTGSGRIGIVSIPSFYRDFQGAANGGSFKSTSRDVKRILAHFRNQGVDAIVVDLRGNGGGALDEAVEVSGLFIPRGPIVQIQSKGQQPTVLNDEDPDMAWRGPMVVVCDRLSASASEIFTGAMRDYRRAIVVGDRTTHGKGTVQNVMPVAGGITLFPKDRGALKLTIGKWYRVNGDGSQIAGIASDVVLPSRLSAMKLGESELENAMPFDRIQRADFIPFTSYVVDGVGTELQKRSEERIRTDEDFGRLNRRIQFVKDREQRKVMSLHKTTASQRHAELKEVAEKPKDDSKDVARGTQELTRFRETFYNREVLNITLDYLQVLRPRA